MRAIKKSSKRSNKHTCCGQERARGKAVALKEKEGIANGLKRWGGRHGEATRPILVRCACSLSLVPTPVLQTLQKRQPLTKAPRPTQGCTRGPSKLNQDKSFAVAITLGWTATMRPSSAAETRVCCQSFTAFTASTVFCSDDPNHQRNPLLPSLPCPCYPET